MDRPQLSRIIRTLVLPAVIGLVAGLAGGLASYPYYLSGTIETLPPSVNRPVFSQTAPLPEAELADRLRSLDLLVFPKSKIKPQTSNLDLADRGLLPADASGMATVLTSDGWLLTHQDVAKGGVMVAVGGRLHEPKTVVLDPVTGAAFLKIDASSLRVSGFEETDLLREGAALYASDAGRLFVKTAFSGTTLPPRPAPDGAGPRRPAALRSSDRFDRAFLLGQALDRKAVGGAVLTVGGNLAGIIVPSREGEGAVRGEFLPMHLLRPVLQDVFRGNAPKRAILGVNYVDLESVTTTETSAVRGAAVSGLKRLNIPAVVRNSPAAVAGIVEGDVILRVEDVSISGGRDLAEVIGEYRPGTAVRIEVSRKGENRTFGVTLTEGVK